MNVCNAINLHATYFKKPVKQAVKQNTQFFKVKLSNSFSVGHVIEPNIFVLIILGISKSILHYTTIFKEKSSILLQVYLLGCFQGKYSIAFHTN